MTCTSCRRDPGYNQLEPLPYSVPAEWRRRPPARNHTRTAQPVSTHPSMPPFHIRDSLFKKTHVAGVAGGTPRPMAKSAYTDPLQKTAASASAGARRRRGSTPKAWVMQRQQRLAHGARRLREARESLASRRAHTTARAHTHETAETQEQRWQQVAYVQVHGIGLQTSGTVGVRPGRCRAWRHGLLCPPSQFAV